MFKFFSDVIMGGSGWEPNHPPIVVISPRDIRDFRESFIEIPVPIDPGIIGKGF